MGPLRSPASPATDDPSASAPSLSSQAVPWRPEAVYVPRASLGADDVLVDSVLSATASGLYVVLAGLDDADAAAMRFDGTGDGRLVLVDASRVLVAQDGRWEPIGPSTGESLDAWLSGHLWRHGIGPQLVAVVSEHGKGSPRSWIANGTLVDVGGATGTTLAGFLANLVAERSNGALPGVDESSGWCLAFGPDDARAPVTPALLALSSGVLGVRGDLEDLSGVDHFVQVSGAYGLGADGLVRPLPGPAVTVFDDLGSHAEMSCRRLLDLHTGVVVRGSTDGLRTARFVSLTRPHVCAVRAEDARTGRPWPPPIAPPTVTSGQSAEFDVSCHGSSGRVRAASGDTVVSAHAAQRDFEVPDRRRVERIIAISRNGGKEPDAATMLEQARSMGFDRLLEEHRSAWAKRWEGADIEIGGDPHAQLAVRYALFHLLSCAPVAGEAAVGARGLTGLAYAGHVFWDTDVFVLPALAATLPAAARAVLQYRINRLGAARLAAAGRGADGARFPWESADSGREVTPTSARDVEGLVVPILTGQHEEHISADIAWALRHYLDWTGDPDVMDEGGRDMVLDTAHYWLSRIRVDDDGRGHLDAVIGPDEYHEIVDDNAFTNNLVRWHLRWAASVGRSSGAPDEEMVALETAADGLTDGFDRERGFHEQFAGYWNLEPLLIGEIAQTPVAADVLLGRDRVRRTQVIKQPDVLMLHHMLPDVCPPGSLRKDLDFYLPRTAHGSSLSPAVCAAQLARAGRPDDALDLFDVAARLDLDDLTHMASGGLHLATMGGLWQAVVAGFAGIRPTASGLVVEPCLPRRWESLSIRIGYRGQPVRVHIDDDAVEVTSETPLPLILAGTPMLTPARLRRPLVRGEVR